MAISGVVNQFVETFKKLSMLQRVSLLAATVAVFATVVVLILWANKPVYKTLYTELPEADIEDVRSALDGKNVPYKLVNGNSITVPADSVYATRMMLALEGLPKAQTTGFELFDETKLGMTEFNQNVNYQRALEGELSRTISSINEIPSARVHLFTPKDRIFVSDDEESKASVMVSLLPGMTLRQDQIRAISHLVASAVKGLKPENVQIVDTSGNLLSEFMTDSENAGYVTATQLEQQRRVEKDIARKVQGLLTRSVGNDKFVTQVTVEMDYSKREIMREEFSDTPVLRSQHSLEINSRRSGQGPSAIPGVESNLAEPDLIIDGILEEYSKSEETQNFEISKTVTHEQKVSGEIRRQTVSVVVDDRPVPVEENGVRTIRKEPRTDDELSKLRAAVASAVGFDEARGDVVEIINIPFDISEDWLAVAVNNKEQLMEWITIAAKYGSAVLILLLFYLLLVRPILKRLDNAQELDDELLGENAIDAQLSGLDIAVGGESGFPKTVEELEREIESELDESVPVDVEAVKSKVMLKKIEESANDDPEMIANLVKALIKGG